MIGNLLTIDLDALDSSLIPETTDLYDIGTDSLRWKDGYFSGVMTVYDLIVESGSSIKLAGATFENQGHYTSVDTNWMVKHEDSTTAFTGVYAENESTLTHANLVLDAYGSTLNIIKNSPSNQWAPAMAGITNENGNFGIFVDHDSEISFQHYTELTKDDYGNITNMTNMQSLMRLDDDYLHLEDVGLKVNDIEIVNDSGVLQETDPIFIAWDKSSGISITESQISDLDHFDNADETDPIFSAWDKSEGISITESQISDLDHFDNADETDPVFIAWDKSSGISITESQISDLSHTPAFDGDIPEIYNSLGLFKIQPDAQGDVELFSDTDVDNSENGKMLYVRRQAPEGNDYIRFYVSAGRVAYIHANNKLTLQAQQPFTINSVTDSIYFKVGDNAGVEKFHFRDSDNNDVVTIDSDGVMTLDKNNGAYLNLVRGTVNKISNFFDSTYTDLRFEGDKDYNRIGTWIDKPFQIVTNSVNRIIIDQYGRVEIPSSLTVGDLEATDDILAYNDVAARNLISRGIHGFPDYSTQEEAGARNHSHGHTHTAIYNDDWYDTDSDGMASRDMHFSPDGLMMYIIGIAGGGIGDCSIWEYPLTTPWDLSTVGTPTIESIETYGSNQTGLYIGRDGRRLWTVCSSNDTIIEYSMSPWDISRLSWVQAKDISGQDTAPSSIFWSPQGNRVYVAGDSDNDIIAFSVTNEWDISGLSWFENFGTNIDAPTGLHFSSDGRRMYVMDGSAEDDIHEFHLSSPWMISSARLVNLFDVSAENSSPQGIFITSDNSKIFMVGTSTPDGVYGYDLGLEVKGKIISGTFKTENMPTSDPTDAGSFWNDGGTVKVSAG